MPYRTPPSSQGGMGDATFLFVALFAGGPLRIAFAEKVPPVLDLSYAVALVLAGWSMSRLARQPG
ncbi:MAG: hypothetical protein JNN24_04165 [Hyphomicrobium zavarzinii]|nr:hypothetical protein [Hyphomicrobium zavarzinii]